jgi:ADP-ribose pyrophosphatase
VSDRSLKEKSFSDLPEDDLHLKEVAMTSDVVYEGIFLNMKRDQVRLPDGNTAQREYLTHPGAVAIMPILNDGRILLERQFRYPINQAVIEIPAGKLDPNEDPLICAQRELKEETGYQANSWEFLGRIHPVISYSNEFIDIYLAHDMLPGQAHLDEEEFLDVFAASLDEIESWISQGVITDVKTIIATYWLKARRQKS